MSAPMLALDPHAMVRVFKCAGYVATDIEPDPFGPAGLSLLIGWHPHRGSVIVTQAEHEGVEWLHASIAYDDRMPDYSDLGVLHRAVFGRRRWAYQVFAPADKHVNIHGYALHLWGRADGAPVLPNFGEAGTI
jgi:hypothetical protein